VAHRVRLHHRTTRTQLAASRKRRALRSRGTRFAGEHLG
jgi:hypothetical protein